MFLTITDQDKLENLALNLVMREKEIMMYQINIDNYNLILSTLPQGDVPENLRTYIGAKPENHTSIMDLPLDMSDEDIALVSSYQHKVNISMVLRTEKAEQAKSKAILEALKAQIPADQLDALVATALAKINAQTPAA